MTGSKGNAKVVSPDTYGLGWPRKHLLYDLNLNSNACWHVPGLHDKLEQPPIGERKI
jgi:hypothetical protein